MKYRRQHDNATRKLQLKKSVARIVILALIVAGAIIAPIRIGTLHQPAVQASAENDPCRFLSVQKWVGSFTLTGNGSGTVSGIQYTVNQSISAKLNLPVLAAPPIQCGGAQWVGDITATVSVNDTVTNSSGTKTTYKGSGDVSCPGPGGAGLMIDAANKQYFVSADCRQIPVKVTTEQPDGTTDTKDGVYFWGPPAFGTPDLLILMDEPLPTSGVTLKKAYSYVHPNDPFPATWGLDLTLTCDNSQRGLNVPAFFQTDAQWAKHKLFKSDVSIGAGGCALTCLAMALDHATQSSAFTPGSLNDFLTANNTGFNGASLVFDPAIRKASDNRLKFHEFTDGSAGDIEDALCQGIPPIVKVDVPNKGICGNAVGTHYVLVTGKQGSTFTINDPGCGHTTLDAYPSFKARGYVGPYSGNFGPNTAQGRGSSGLTAAATADNSSLSIGGDNNVELMVIDPAGERTGFVPAIGSVVEEITDSVYFSDNLANIDTGNPPDNAEHQLQIDKPASGTYQVIFTTRQPGPYSISIYPYSQDGLPQTPTVIQGTTQTGSGSLQIQYSSAPGSSSSITQSCASISALNIPFTPAGGTGAVDVTSPGGCSWTAVSNAGWITINSGGSGTGNGQVSYQVSPSSSSRTGTITVANQTLTVNQAGTASPPTVQFSLPNYTAGEGNSSAVVTVTRTGDVSGAATVDYATADNSALQRSDYTLAVGTLKFAAGEASKTFTVLITDNAYFQGDRDLNLALTNPTGAGLGSQSTATLTILENDTAAPTTNPLDNADARFFVRQQYYDFLSREPDQSGFDFWAGQITQCAGDQTCIRQKRIDVSNAFFYELEYQQTGSYVFRMYRAAYGNNQPFPNPDASNQGEANKLPDYSVFSQDRARVIGSANLAQAQLDLANLFVARPEFVAKYPLSEDGPTFVDALLGTIKNDTGADLTSQRAGLITLFNSGGRGAVIYRLADDNVQTNPVNNRGFIDEEYNRAFVATQYFGYLRRDADIGGFLFWLGQVNSAPLRDTSKQHAMVCSFITSTEYQLRFSSVTPHSNGECQ
jgi:hypothetical protein